MQGGYSNGSFLFNYWFISKGFSQTLIISDKTLCNFEVEYPRWFADNEDHAFSKEDEKNSPATNDTVSWHENNRSGQMQVRNAGSVQERADELQDLSIAAAKKNEAEDWVTGIQPRLIKILINCSFP